MKDKITVDAGELWNFINAFQMYEMACAFGDAPDAQQNGVLERLRSGAKVTTAPLIKKWLAEIEG
jgi:hypothetical protein